MHDSTVVRPSASGQRSPRLIQWLTADSQCDLAKVSNDVIPQVALFSGGATIRSATEQKLKTV